MSTCIQAMMTFSYQPPSTEPDILSVRLFGKQMIASRQTYDPRPYSYSDDTRSETSTLVDFRSDDGASILAKKTSHGVVAEMLDPEDAAWGSPPSSSFSVNWSKLAPKWPQNRRGQDSHSRSKLSSSSGNARQGWAQDFDPEDQAWSRK
ncbi:hypothetical protein K435DRAFT_971441 [Dendrothele bispora CBS 962.96]|uniref:Uncharacterized protein n=1 Tax=Dendrothele bispora (strain CBS 962.96) TaxID=1314807 RepID=A0A4S8L581_DENBC|nr:hypothetical protein K435DRAFT_971441 [Dendrothele bispora CBS 962.96]